MIPGAALDDWTVRIGRSIDRWTHVARYHRAEQLSRRLWNRLCSVAAPIPARPLLRSLPAVRRAESLAPAAAAFGGVGPSLEDLCSGQIGRAHV